MEKPTIMSNALEKNGHRDTVQKGGPPRNSDDRFENASTLAEGGVTRRDKTMEETQRLANPLSGMSPEEVLLEADRFADERDMLDIRDDLRKGALVAAFPADFENIKELSEEEKEYLRWETTHPWRQTKTLWALVVCCAMGAAVQGQDQSLINAANIFFPQQFGIGSTAWRDVWLLGAVNSAPYFTCLLVACWVTDPLNRYFGRKGTIMISLVFATFPCVWAACSNSWQMLLASRVVLAFGIGPKSSTVPIYASEAAPPKIRGTLVMQWQLWTAFGIMIGYVCGLMFYNVSDTSNITGLNWRLMLGSGVVPPLVVLAQVIFLPESPRWLLSKNRPRKAYEALLRLRNSPLEAARDLFYISQLLKVEDAMHTGNRYKELFSIPRNRRASQSAFLVMFMQQFCGINVIAYYSSRIFVDSGFSQFNALLASWGFGMINWLGAIPAMKTIDSFGRRTLLLFGFPTMGFFLAFTGSMFYLPDQADGEATPVKLGLIAVGIYLFAMAYSPSEGPVPFTYSAEAFPLYIRPIGMAFATATCWGFNGVLALTFPALQEALTPSGSFYFYASFNVFGFFMVLFFLPETAKLSLEELDSVFSVPTRKQAQWGAKQPSFWWKRYVLRQKDLKPEPLYELDPGMVRTYAEASGAH